ncbi:MAG TPA: hypothetical protein VGC08_10755 [Pedobacter sp.]
MVLFTKRNLYYHDYLWAEYLKDDSRISGKPDSTIFNRTEGNQVVYLINKLMILWSYRFSNTGNKMEKLIREKMPEEIQTQKEVQDWLQQNLTF